MTTLRAILQRYPSETEWEGSGLRVSGSWLLDRWSPVQLDRAAIIVDDTIYGVTPNGGADPSLQLLVRSPWVEIVPCMKSADAERLFRRWLEQH